MQKLSITTENRLFILSVLIMCGLFSLVSIISIKNFKAQEKFIDDEIDGIFIVQDILHAIKYMQVIRGLSEFEDADNLAVQEKIKLESMINHPEWLNPRLFNIKKLTGHDRAFIVQSILTIKQAKNFYQHTQIIDQQFNIIRAILDNSNLILDPYLESYYLMYTSLIRIPTIIRFLAEMRGNLASQNNTLDDDVLNNELASALTREKQIIGLMFDDNWGFNQLSSMDQQYQHKIRNMSDSIAKILILLRQFKKEKSQHQHVHYDNLFRNLSLSMENIFNTQTYLLEQLRRILEQRRAEISKNYEISLVAFIITLLMYLMFSMRYFREKQQTQEALQRLSLTDPLTKLRNRRSFEDVIERQILLAKREHHYLLISMLDIDFFKKLNDHYGHAYGDECLKKVGKILMNCCQRPYDFAFRMGGEEFCIISQHTEKDKLTNLLDKFKEQLEKANLAHEYGLSEKRVTMSIGASFSQELDTNQWNQMLSDADDALYKAKQQGRNRIIVQQYKP